MSLEAGRLSDDLGPLTVIKGMDASVPEHELAPNNPENLFNVDIDRGGRAINRPGSIFHARLGEGPVQGILEHAFETGTESPRLVAIVHRPYDEVNNLESSSDGVAGTGSGFCGDVSTNGQSILPFLARMSDRFHITSFLDRIYFAGSTIDHKVWEFKYDSGGVLTQVSGTGMSPFVPLGTCVLAYGNRLYVAGNPDRPSLIYPSGGDDPTDWQEQLAFQVGTRNDAIIRLLEHDGLIVALSRRTSSWVLAGDIPAGDVQVDDISTTHGCVGALAADEGGDGWVYWISKTDGPVRWRRGAALDRSFAYPMADIWRKIERSNTDLSTAVVKWDPVDRAMRFEIPTGPAEEGGENTPNYLMSYFVDSNAWTHGASTEDTSLATGIRDLDVLASAMGARRYSCLTHRRDHQDGKDKIYGGDGTGHVWVWKNESVDKVRDVEVEGEEGSDFTSLIRWGNIEIAPVGYRGVIEELLINFIGGYEYEFDVYSDQDYAGFNLIENCVRALDGGTLTLVLDDNTGQDTSRIFGIVKAPIKVRVSNWARLIGKALRLEMTWTGSKQTMAFSGIEFERSIEAHDSRKAQTPPDPPEVEFEPDNLSGIFDGTSGFTDFSEMETNTPNTDPPEGMDPLCTNGTYEILDGGAEGSVLRISGASNARFGGVFDFFGNTNLVGEILVRMRCGEITASQFRAANNRISATFSTAGGGGVMGPGFGYNTEDRVGIFGVSGVCGANSSHQAAEAFVLGTWYWVRARKDFVSGDVYRFRVKKWAGALGDEPGSWTIDDTTDSADLHTPTSLGLQLTRFNVTGALWMECGYFAYSNDPDATAPPEPA